MSGPTKEEIEAKKKATKKKIAGDQAKRRYNIDLKKRLKDTALTFGNEKYVTSKFEMARLANGFEEKYTGENSDFNIRIEYLKSTLGENSEEYKNTPEAKLMAIIEKAKDGVKAYKDYASYTHRLIGNNEKLKIEGNYLKQAKTSFSEVKAMLEEFDKEEFSVTDTYSNFLYDVTELIRKTEKTTNGGLVIPENTFVIRPTEKVDGETVIMEPKARYDEDKEEYEKIKYVDVSDEPLFSHEPCPEDVRQGQLGDCYFIAAMAGIAGSDPDSIRNAMKDNNDGTVTVRFYNGKSPVYVTVTKSVPVKLDSNNVASTHSRYANGSLWVQLMEKAYAQVGIEADLLYDLLDGDNQITSYDALAGGNSGKAVLNLLGNQVPETEQTSKIDMPEPGETKNYSKSELSFYNHLKATYRKGAVITTGIEKGKTTTMSAKMMREYEKHKGEPGYKKPSSYELSKGLPDGHAYTINGFSKDKNGKLYVRVRNPHASMGRSYDEYGRPQLAEKPIRPGESLIELRDFVKTFDEVYQASLNKSPIQKMKNEMAKFNADLYKDAVVQMVDEIVETSPGYMVGFNSKEFNQLKAAAINLKQEFIKKNLDLDQMDKKMQEFFDKSDKYKKYRDERSVAESQKKDSRDRSTKRYQLVDAASRFKEIYEKNKKGDASYVDFDQLKEEALDKDLAASRGKQKMQEGLRKDQTLSNEQIQERKNEIEAKSKDLINEGMKKGNPEKLIEGLSNLMLLDAVEKDKSMDQKEVARHLSDNYLERTKDKLDKKIESALKHFTKDEFNNAIKSGDFEKNMANLVNAKITQAMNKTAPNINQNQIQEENRDKQLNQEVSNNKPEKYF